MDPGFDREVARLQAPDARWVDQHRWSRDSGHGSSPRCPHCGAASGRRGDAVAGPGGAYVTRAWACPACHTVFESVYVADELHDFEYYQRGKRLDCQACQRRASINLDHVHAVRISVGLSHGCGAYETAEFMLYGFRILRPPACEGFDDPLDVQLGLRDPHLNAWR